MAWQTHSVQRLLASVISCSLSLRLTFVILILWCELTAIGQLTPSPMMVAPVCLGGQVNLTCTASVEFLEWSFIVVNKQGRDEPFTIFTASSGPSQRSMPIVVNSTNFTVIRNSGGRILPLISTLSISSVSVGLNGTVMNCIDAGNMLTSASTTIQIINTSQNQYTPILHITVEEYGAGNVTVTVEWASQAGAVYTARVSPLVPMLFTGGTSRQLTIQYNTDYNLSVVAVTLCRPNTTALIRLNYANCGYPNLLPSIGNNFVPRIEGYDGLSVEGSTIMLICPPGLVLIGPNSAICTENGEWEPDPSGVICNDSKGNSQTDVSRSINGFAAAFSSTVIVFLMISIVTFITGFVFGHYIRGRKYKQSPKKVQEINPTSTQPAAPLYEDVDVLPIASAVEHQEQGLKLKENVAYGPSKSTRVEQQ